MALAAAAARLLKAYNLLVVTAHKRWLYSLLIELVSGHQWLEDDFNGDVLKAERALFIKLLDFAQGRGIPTLFRRMNGNGDGRLDLDEWIPGCRNLVHIKQSDWMLTELFELMDGCDDPACEYAEPDNCLSYAELFAKMTHWHNVLKTESGLAHHRVSLPCSVS